MACSSISWAYLVLVLGPRLIGSGPELLRSCPKKGAPRQPHCSLRYGGVQQVGVLFRNLYVCMYVCMYVRMYVCMYVCLTLSLVY